MVFESSLNKIPDVDSVSSNTNMLNDVEVATDLNTIPCSSQVLRSSDIPEAELNLSNTSTTTETQALDLSEVPEVEPNPSVLCTSSCKRKNKKAKSVQRKVFDISSLLSKVQKKDKQRIIQRVIEIVRIIIEYYSKLIRNARKNPLSKVEAPKALETVYGDVLHNLDFQKFLARTIGLSGCEQLSDFLEYADESQ